MADFQQIQVNEPVEGEQMTLEEHASKLDAEGKLAQDEGAVPEEQEIQEDRPEWLPEKFKSAEDLATAYAELEKQQGGAPEATAETDEPSEVSGMNSVLETATAEYGEKGELTEETFKILADNGLPEDVVNAYIAGQEALAANQTLEIQSAVGGEEQYNEMITWAGEQLSDEEVNAYNAILESGSIDQARVAVKGLHAQYQASAGGTPKLTQGNTSGSTVTPFGSAAQVTAAMRDNRYTTDPAFRRSVEKRLAVSDVL